MSDLCQRVSSGTCTITAIRGIETHACVLTQGWGQLMGRGTIAGLQKGESMVNSNTHTHSLHVVLGIASKNTRTGGSVFNTSDYNHAC